MKRLAVLCAALALFLPLAYGQALPPQVKAEIPFDFYLGDRAMPAGEYMILNNQFPHKQLIVVQRMNGRVSAALAMGSFTEDPTIRGDRIELVFAKYDNDHTFLRTVRSEATRTTLELQKSRTEREHVTSTFRPVANAAPARIVVLASLR